MFYLFGMSAFALDGVWRRRLYKGFYMAMARICEASLFQLKSLPRLVFTLLVSISAVGDADVLLWGELGNLPWGYQRWRLIVMFVVYES